MAVAHRRREKCPAYATQVFREGGQLSTTSDNFFRATVCGSTCGHEGSFLPAKACHDGAVWLVDRHENFIGIVLPKARQVHQEAMFVRHGQFNVFHFWNLAQCRFTHRI